MSPNVRERGDNRTDPTHEQTADVAIGSHPPNWGPLLSPRQRLILFRVAACGGTTSTVTLARDVAAAVADQPHDSVAPDVIRRTFLDLQSSLEELSRAGHLEYCEDVGTVALANSTG